MPEAPRPAWVAPGTAPAAAAPCVRAGGKSAFWFANATWMQLHQWSAPTGPGHQPDHKPVQGPRFLQEPLPLTTSLQTQRGWVVLGEQEYNLSVTSSH